MTENVSPAGAVFGGMRCWNPSAASMAKASTDELSYAFLPSMLMYWDKCSVALVSPMGIIIEAFSL